jgi:DNA-binding MarR family transcriptional regulator
MQRAPQQISPVELHLAYWLHYMGCRVFNALRLGALEFGVTAAESVVLRKLHEHENGAMPSYLALRLGLSCGYISRLAMRLEAKGLVHRDKKSVSDRRTLMLTLTDQGRALLPTLAELANQTNSHYFAEAGEVAHETVERVMKWNVHRHRYRFVPPVPCRIRKYRYQHLGIYWDLDGDEEGDGEGVSQG